jgi:uncharacterized protein YjiS (DUF1127 family)
MTDTALTVTRPDFIGIPRHLWFAVLRWHHAQCTRSELSNLPDYMLRDIGVRRDAIEGVTWASVDAVFPHRLR